MSLRAADTSLFFSRQDSEDPRLGDLVLKANPTSVDRMTHILGWPDDEGIKLNGGRPGAADAPDRIRRALYKMTPPVSTEPLTPFIQDLGNLEVSSHALPDRHQEAKKLVTQSFDRGFRVLTLGGGHDYGYPDCAAFVDSQLRQGKRPAVINFDAHLDVRPVKDHFHSGTPFRRLLEEFSGKFDFLEVGLQPQCNSRFHADWARNQGAELWWAPEIQNPDTFQKKMSEWAFHRRNQPLFVSLDIDAMDSSHAPGCSQSWALGISPWPLRHALDLLGHLMDWKGLGIYEVSPPLDLDDRTSKLAALFAHQFLFQPVLGGLS